MLNLHWGGVESNQVGTAEFVDFCRQTRAEPLMCVNLESDGRSQYRTARGMRRSADAREAARWGGVLQRANAERRAHGHFGTVAIKYWQLGNETSYDKDGFDLATAAANTVRFAKAMRQVDPSIELIAWGDSGWAGRMLEIAGECVQFLGFHHMFNPDSEKQPVLRGELYRRDAGATWHQLMRASELNDAKIR